MHYAFETRSQVSAHVIGIVAEHFGVDPPEETANLAGDFGGDSLDIMEIVMELEDDFNIQIDDEHTTNPAYTTIRAIVDALCQKLGIVQ